MTLKLKLKSRFIGGCLVGAVLVGSALSSHLAGAQELGEEKRSKLSEILKSWFGDSEDAEGDGGEGTDGGGSITGLEEGAEVYSPAAVLSPEELSISLPWRAPEYSNQTGALGWSETAFSVPKGMEARVAFWRDIYSKYTTDQGLLHDSVHVGVVYTPVDFTAIMQDKATNLHQKARLREKLVDQKRQEIVERLRRLHGRSSASGLSGEDLRIWKLFDGSKDENRFLAAAEKGRVRFQLGQKDKFVLGIYYSGRYLREMEKIFRDDGLPIELTRLPFVESSFNINARSRVGASGVWQFMPRTAKPFMKVGKDVDERNDPIKATRASAKVLRQNYQMLEAWPLAVTGYNHGPYGVRGITNKLGTKDLAEIIERYSSRTFGFASENFYACFLAAVEIERNAKKYFGDVRWSPEVPGREIKVTHPIAFSALRAFFDDDEDEASLMNPHLTSRVRTGKAKIPQGTFIRVPESRATIAENFMRGRIEPSKLVAAVQAVPWVKPTLVPVVLEEPAAPQPETQTDAVSSVTVSAEPAQEPELAIEPAVIRTHKVRPGDNLIRIAKKYGVDLQELKKMNKLEGSKRKSTIKVGQILSLPPARESERP